MSGAWSCPHDIDGVCQRVNGAVCDPGMRGCELEGRFRFARDEQNQPRKPVRAAPRAEEGLKQKPATPRRRLPF